MAYMDELRVGDECHVLSDSGKNIGHGVIIRLQPDETGGPYSRVTVCFSDDLELVYVPDRIRLIGSEDDGA